MITIDIITELTEVTNTEFNVEQINSIEVNNKDIRQDSKAPTFLLTYDGTWRGLMKNCGFSEEEAKRIEANYHELYKESDEWKHNKIMQSSIDGYVTLAFGLRLRTPLLKQSILGTTSTLYQAESEARTAANAFGGQSYGLLNNRAAVGFMKRVWASKWRYDIKPIALIHDAIYLIIKDDIECVKWVNDNLIQEMEWQDLPELRHDIVKLSAQLEVYYPSWNNPIKLPNKANEIEIQTIINQSISNTNNI